MTEPLRDEAETEAGHERLDDEVQHSDPAEPGPGLPPPTATESLVNALLEAGPEVAEHVVRAAQELLLAAQTIVDAADKAIQEQQTIRAAPRDDTAGLDDSPDDEATAAVRHLDLAD